VNVRNAGERSRSQEWQAGGRTIGRWQVAIHPERVQLWRGGGGRQACRQAPAWNPAHAWQVAGRCRTAVNPEQCSVAGATQAVCRCAGGVAGVRSRQAGGGRAVQAEPRCGRDPRSQRRTAP